MRTKRCSLCEDVFDYLLSAAIVAVNHSFVSLASPIANKAKKKAKLKGAVSETAIRLP